MLKRIDLYLLKRFGLLLLMTFMICLFILLMQFLWKHFEDLVGKGIGWDTLAEFFLYAILSLVPMSLPLAILLASLMTFGNLGENFELTAMKASGISLFRIIRPLVIFIILVSFGAFYFTNTIVPISQKKLWTLIYSLKQKAPELEIPTGEFYTGINGYNLYIREKDDRLLKDMMIYDFSNGFNNATVMVADSGRIHLTADNKYLFLVLYNGESFENVKKQKISNSFENVPYRREVFSRKEILIDFDSEFSRLDESVFEDQYISKNVQQLSSSIDSVNKIMDIRSTELAQDIINHRYFGREYATNRSLEVNENIEIQNFKPDSLYLSLNLDEKSRAMSSAIQRANEMNSQIQYNNVMLGDSNFYVTRHKIEWHRKLTLSFACLIFFFIGAPLGAIIRKGGLGAPVVISVIMFIFYYIIDNTGFKMSRENIWTAFEGMWLSSAVLLPIGIFLTYKAAVDATLFNAEEYAKFIKRIRFFFNTKILKKKYIYEES